MYGEKVSLHKDQLGLQKSGAIDITFTIEDQHQKHHANSTSPYMSKQFEIGLSPIFEDTHTFANTLRGSNRVEIKPATTDTVDSSGSSYGELIQDKTIDYPRDQYWSDEFWETFEDSSLIPELTLTAPTPEMGISTKFPSEHQPIRLSGDGGLDYQGPEAIFARETAKACRPNRLGYTTALSSISKALGAGADMLLGAGNGVFDDMLDTGVIYSSTSRRPAAHPGNHLGNDWPASLATQSLGSEQAETGFLGQLLRRKRTGRSKMSRHGSRVVSHILRSSRRSGSSACNQENPTATASAGPLERSHAANGFLNLSLGWKRFSRILTNAKVSSRRRSAGDTAQFTESVDPLEGDYSGVFDRGSTRRHGLDIPSDGAEHVGERWNESSSPDTATRAYINEKHAARHLGKPSDISESIGTARNWYGNLFEPFWG
ncbi:hypothetical protein BYT27DRAFT_7212919 [Phlegmacium glaucopus]|nr:hypothetical protein BYT27DRAFT_7212919 [Phlegmacium glaucopus]